MTGRGPGNSDPFEAKLEERLAAIRAADRWRSLQGVESAAGTHLQIEGQSLLNFAANDYLGLATHPALREGAVRAVETYGAGSTASRLVCGSLRLHHELEDALAEFKGAEAALVFSSGHAAALGTIPALVGREDVVVLDRLAHACLVDAARLSGAKLRVFAHNDLDDLERILRWARARATSDTSHRPHILIVTESVFSMDGDRAPLKELVELKDRHGAWLMVDEAHATGLYGEHRRGLAEATGVAERIEVQMGTLGKALGVAGGFIYGSRRLCEFLVNRARSFIFSTAPPPALSGAALAAVRLVRSEEGRARCAALWDRCTEMRQWMTNAGWAAPATLGAIFPLIVGSESAALDAARQFRQQGFFIPAIRPPTVPRGTARLRLSLSAAHTQEEVARLGRALFDYASTRSP